MKTNVKSLNWLCLALIFVFFTGIKAQQIQGIYLTGEDFKSNKLSFSKSKGKKCKAKLHDLYYKPYITVKYCDSVYSFKKDSIFGYKETSGTSNRFFNKQIYPVLNQAEPILLYRTIVTTANVKNPQTIIRYYFSKDAHSPVLPLTERNLEDAFKDNKLFIEYLEIHFRDDSELPEYDYVNKMYKINRLLQLSLKPKTN